MADCSELGGVRLMLFSVVIEDVAMLAKEDERPME